MSTVVTENLKRTSETASRSLRGVAAAWLNMTGTGTIVINDSLNVASLVDNGTGTYVYNLTSAIEAAARYVPLAGGLYTSAGTTVVGSSGPITASQVALIVDAVAAASNRLDRAAYAVLHGDLA